VDASRDRSQDYTDIAYWTDLARLLERGKFDGLFLADIVGVYDVYQGNTDLTLRETIQLPVNDPLMLVSAMAAVTEHLGFGVTANLTYESPVPVRPPHVHPGSPEPGRVGWNIVPPISTAPPAPGPAERWSTTSAGPADECAARAC
jgi:hypothetical protein